MAKMNIGNDEFHLRYYNQDDIPNVLQVLYESMQHRPIFHDIYQMKESVKKLNIHMSSQGNAINGWRVIFKGKKSKSVGTANERKKFPGAYGIGRETIKKRNWELGLGFMFSVGSMNGIGSINEPPDDNDSNAPNVTKLPMRPQVNTPHTHGAKETLSQVHWLLVGDFNEIISSKEVSACNVCFALKALRVIHLKSSCYSLIVCNSCIMSSIMVFTIVVCRLENKRHKATKSIKKCFTKPHSGRQSVPEKDYS
ncbi:hypothetical protein JHK84_048125 [Glycine max]|nr:hypothetical protein JHK84_048125 [Glycine max]